MNLDFMSTHRDAPDRLCVGVRRTKPTRRLFAGRSALWGKRFRYTDSVLFAYSPEGSIPEQNARTETSTPGEGERTSFIVKVTSPGSNSFHQISAPKNEYLDIVRNIGMLCAI